MAGLYGYTKMNGNPKEAGTQEVSRETAQANGIYVYQELALCLKSSFLLIKID